MADARQPRNISPTLAEALRSIDVGRSITFKSADFSKSINFARTVDISPGNQIANTLQGTDWAGTSKWAELTRKPHIAESINWAEMIKTPDLAQTIDFGQAFRTANFAKTFEVADFSKVLGRTTFGEAFNTSGFTNVVGRTTFPRIEWDSLLNVLRTNGIPNSAVDELAEVELGPDDTTSERESWILRLSLIEQVGLFVAALKVLDEVGKFAADVAGDSVPSELRNATQVLFAVVVLLLLALEKRSSVDHSDRDSS